MGKPSQLDTAIANLEAEIAVLQAAIAKLKQRQKPATPRVVKVAEKGA